jgi:hypothetical protein
MNKTTNKRIGLALSLVTMSALLIALVLVMAPAAGARSAPTAPSTASSLSPAVAPSPDGPTITVSPMSMEPLMVPDDVMTEPLTIGNVGDSQLDWLIYEDTTLLQEDWFEDWDSYPTGQNMHGVGGWKGWGNDPAATAYTTDAQARSAPNSIDILGASDLVHEYDIDAGPWRYTAWQYIPGDFSGESYFILLNQYDDAGATNNWSTQVNFSSLTGMVTPEGLCGGTPVPLVQDQWVEIRVEIDLDADTQEFYYDDQLVWECSWSEGVSGGGITSIAAVDLFANLATSVYYDDLSLINTTIETCDFPNDIPWVSVEPITGTTMPGESSIADVTFDSTGLGLGIYEGTLCVSSNDPVNPIVQVPLTLTVVSCIPLTDATIDGPAELMVDEEGTYVVTWEPADATPPISIEWSNGITEPTAVFSWTMPGTYTIAVSVTNCAEVTVVDTYEVVVMQPQPVYSIYVPIVSKNT